MALSNTAGHHGRLRVLAITQAQWGERIADNISRTAPATWTVHRWAAPRVIPLVVDDPEDYLPATLPACDLILSLGETAGVVQLLPDAVRMTGARSVIVPIDRNESVPSGLVRQLQGWLADLSVTVVFPRPFCTLTPESYNQPPVVVRYTDALISEFAAHFGRPRFRVSVGEDRRITDVAVECDSACGCAYHVAQGLLGYPVEEAEFEAGMLHHHFPCLASMNQDADYHDTLMHVSGHVLRDAIKEQIREHLEPTPYLRPQGRIETAVQNPPEE